MAENSKIEWTHHTFSPWIGCTKIGPGCDHCYAESMNNRFKGGNWGVGAPRRRTSAANWKLPLKWNREAAKTGERLRVFCASLADVFDNEVDQLWREDLWTLIESTPNLDWLLLTKRIGNVSDMAPGYWSAEGWPENVWLGVTVVNQAEADRDIPKLLSVPAKIRWLSMEPLLGPVDLRQAHMTHYKLKNWPAPTRVDWVVVGGESGAGARPMHPDWAISLRDQCELAGIPFLFKQWGEWAPNYFLHDDGSRDESTMWMDRMGKKMAGRKLDGTLYDGYPLTKIITKEAS